MKNQFCFLIRWNRAGVVRRPVVTAHGHTGSTALLPHLDTTLGCERVTEMFFAERARFCEIVQIIQNVYSECAMINCIFVMGNLSAKILYELWYLLHFIVPQSGLMLRTAVQAVSAPPIPPPGLHHHGLTFPAQPPPRGPLSLGTSALQLTEQHGANSRAAVKHVPFNCVLKSYGLVQLKNQKQKRSEWELKVYCRFVLLVIALQRGGARSVLQLPWSCFSTVHLLWMKGISSRSRLH